MKKKDADILLRQSIGFLQKRNFETAEQLLKQAVEIEPFRSELHYHLGNTLAALNKIEKAIHHLGYTIHLNEKCAEAHNNLGRIFHRNNHFDKAFKHYQLALKYRPDYIDAGLNLGLLWVKQGRHNFAKKQFESVLLWDEKLPLAYEQLAQLAIAENDYLKAKEYYHKYLHHTKNSSDIWNNLGAVLVKIGDYNDAIQSFTKALDISPEHVEARNNRAALYLQQSRLKEAIWEYTLYLRIAKEDVTGYYNLGVAFMLSGRLEEAIDAFQAAVKKYPNYLDAWCNLGVIYIQQSKTQLAFEAYQQVLIQQPEHEIARFMVSALSQSREVQLNAKQHSKLLKAAPLSYVKELFNAYAGHFEAHLNYLDYQVPNKLYNWMQPYLQQDQFKTLDLGCGTGLVGAVFQANVSQITGVDISANMLKEAQKKLIYKELIESDLLSFLKNTNDCYELILCIDTLVYFGSLETVITEVLKCASFGSYFVFSIEVMADDALEKKSCDASMYYCLQSTGRYQHSLKGIKKIAEVCGWQWIDSLVTTGRLHNNQPILTGLCLLQKPF